jgi:peptide deformylase
MAILKIARMGHAVLREPALPITDPTAPEIRHLVADMIDTMADAGGTGLAAPQVHVPLRLIVFQVSAGRTTPEEGDGPEPLTVLINPMIEALTQDKATDWEGCLSLPGLMGAVPRWTRIRYRALGLDGAAIERTAAGFHARVVQHECDHLEGVLYPMRIEDFSRFGYVEEMRRFAPQLPEEKDL